MAFSSCVMRFAMTDGAARSSRAAAEKLPSRATRMKELILRRLLTIAPYAPLWTL
jgi:hypothetical protein